MSRVLARTIDSGGNDPTARQVVGVGDVSREAHEATAAARHSKASSEAVQPLAQQVTQRVQDVLADDFAATLEQALMDALAR